MCERLHERRHRRGAFGEPHRLGTAAKAVRAAVQRGKARAELRILRRSGRKIRQHFILRAQRIEHAAQQRTERIGVVRGKEYAVVLQQQYLCVAACLRFILRHTGAAELCEDITGLARLNPDRVREQLFRPRFPVDGAGQTVDRRRMQVQHVPLRKQRVQQRFDARAFAVLPGQLCSHEIGERRRFARVVRLRVRPVPHAGELFSVHRDEAVRRDRGERSAGAFDIQDVPVLGGRVAAAREHELGIGAVAVGKCGQIL